MIQKKEQKSLFLESKYLYDIAREFQLDTQVVSIDTFRHYAEGYLTERSATMTDSEREWLAFSALYITYEQVLRFLMDYIDGDSYYTTVYPTHNLVRARAQHRLLESMEQLYDAMCEIIRGLS